MAVIATQGSKFQCFQTEELSLVLVFSISCKKLIIWVCQINTHVMKCMYLQTHTYTVSLTDTNAGHDHDDYHDNEKNVLK